MSQRTNAEWIEAVSRGEATCAEWIEATREPRLKRLWGAGWPVLAVLAAIAIVTLLVVFGGEAEPCGTSDTSGTCEEPPCNNWGPCN